MPTTIVHLPNVHTALHQSTGGTLAQSSSSRYAFVADLPCRTMRCTQSDIAALSARQHGRETMRIQITIRNVYGNETAYPADETAMLFASMLGRKTLTPADLKHIQALGYTIDVVMHGVTLGQLAA